MLLLVLSTLVLQGYGKQEGTANNTPSRQNIPRKVIRLDPLLRRALLRALTELEREALEKAKTEERNVRSDTNATSTDLRNEHQQQPEVKNEEIQSTADTNYPTPSPSSPQETIPPQESSTNPEPTQPATIQDAFFFQTPSPIEDDLNNQNQQETKSPDSTLTPPDIESNLISEDIKNDNDLPETTGRSDEVSTEKSQTENVTKKVLTKTIINDNDVDIFKAPLVAAFTLHQDSKGTPHSVIPLFRKQNNEINQRQKLLEQQLAAIKQQQQQFLARQNQFIPSVTITPLSQPHHFNQQQQQIFGAQKLQQSFPSSTAFPPLISNSILPQTFSSSVIPSQSFHVSSTIAPIRNNFVSTIAPPRNNFSPNSFSSQGFSSTLLPPQQDFRGISVGPTHSFNFSPTPQPHFSSPSPTPVPAQGFQPISIPPVTLPLQNEPRFQNPIVVPSIQINAEQSFLQNQEQQQRIRNQFLIDEQNRQRQLEEQNRQRQIEEQNRQRQLEEQNRQRQLEEQNRQRQLEEQNRQRQLEEQNRQRLAEEQRQRQAEDERQRKLAEQNIRQENKDQLRPQRQEHGVDFQRSLGFTFNQNLKQNFNAVPQTPSNNAFNFQIQPSQAFVSSVGFHDVETRNRVNRQEAFGATGNFGFNRPINQIPKEQDQRTFGTSQFQTNQPFQTFQQQQPQQYRTIPEEHYRSLQGNRFQQIQEGNRFQPNQFQFRQQSNQFQNQVQSVNKQLENLLYQSGVATDASGQEDLNIVSKVLALNHERSDTGVDETQARSERRTEEIGKGLLVGEIKDISVTTAYPVQK